MSDTTNDPGLITESSSAGVPMGNTLADITEGSTTYYPDTAIGSLMRDRDVALGSARNARAQCEQFETLAVAADNRAAALQSAIDALSK